MCLKHKHNNHKEERAERRLSWNCCVCQLCPRHNGAGPGARRSWGSRVLLQNTDAAHSAWRPFFQHNAPTHSKSQQKPGEPWVRQGDRRGKAADSLMLISSDQSQPRVQEPGRSPAFVGFWPCFFWCRLPTMPCSSD